ncbi:MAG: FG-GAP repeat protein [Deltaproteobacteria bacterium]|nr:FG-GAP repeat protein [Deltaproteobacteria bacterium]
MLWLDERGFMARCAATLVVLVALSGCYRSAMGDDDDGASVEDGTAWLPPTAPAPLTPALDGAAGSLWAPTRLGSLRPELRWTAGPDDGLGPWSYDVQIDDSCETSNFADCGFPSPEASGSGIRETRWTPTIDLPVDTTPPVGRRYFWRIRGCRAEECTLWSLPRLLSVGRVPFDVNGDGYSDLAIGAMGLSIEALAEGGVLLFFGGPTGLAPTPDVVLVNPDHQESALFGSSVSAAGDVNADGFCDLIVGALGQNRGAENEGNAFLYLGSVDGPHSAPDVVLDNPENFEGGSFGISVAVVGDVDSDGYADIVIGTSPGGGLPTGHQESAFEYLGGAEGIRSTPDLVIRSPDWPAEMGDFGFGVAGAGDVNGDGYADVVIGASWAGSDGFWPGKAHVYYGGSGGLRSSPDVTLEDPDPGNGFQFGDSIALGDVDGDGYADVVVGARVQDEPSLHVGSVFVFAGGKSGVARTPRGRIDNPLTYLFGDDVAAGDLDRDGDDEVVVGGADVVFVYDGSPDGIVSDSSTTLDDPTPTLACGTHWTFGFVGDVNADGFTDLAMGYLDPSGTSYEPHSVCVYLGRSGEVDPVPAIVL